MRKKRELQSFTPGTKEDYRVDVTVDVTKIVKYCCVCAVCIVGIIFGVNTYIKMLREKD
ncbi:hypothetical protein [Anaerolentibacter hominis]|uniref:hypothetical protein n=1 Tax=Anaerolentibacter hominis TaxID=3079009 RepID=UPI0031B8AA0B